MVRLSSSPGARIASLRSLSTYRPTTPGCAASHHLRRGTLPAPPGAAGSAPARAAGLGGRPGPPRSWKVGPGGLSPGCAAFRHEWSGPEDPQSGTGSTMRVHTKSTRRSDAPRRGSRRGRQGQQGHVRRQARGAPRYEYRHARHRQAPAEQHKATTPEASAPRSGSPSGQTRRAQERAPASHREERQAATPTKAAQLTPEADARRAVIREAKRAESPARPGRKADQESPLRWGGERGGAFWAVQFHRNRAEKCP